MRLVLVGAVLAAAIALVMALPSGRGALGYPTSPTPSPFVPGSAAFYGFACIDADCLGILTVPVLAKIGDVVCGQMLSATLPSDGQHTKRYYIEVAPDDDIAGCGTEGATVEFYIDGHRANQTGIWTSGSYDQLNIWVGSDFAAFSGYTTCEGKWCYFCFEPCLTASITAYIDGKLCGTQRPYGYLIANSYGPLIVKSDESEPGCGTPGATVTFKIDGANVAENASWSPGFQGQNLTAGSVLWGDNDCSGQLDARDIIRILRLFDELWPDPPNLCFNLLQRLAIISSVTQVTWADIDCSGVLTLGDAIKLLLVASEIAIDRSAGCPPPGTILRAYPVVTP